MNKWYFFLFLSLSIFLISSNLINADLISFNYGGDSSICINDGLDTCNFNYLQEEETPSSPPPTSSVTHSNQTNLTNISIPPINKTETNETKITEIENKGKELNLWIYILIGIISLLILIASVLFDLSKRKSSKDAIMFIITCMIFSVIALTLSIYYKSIYSTVFLILIVLIFMSIVMITILTKDNKKYLDLFGAMFICLIGLIFSGAMLLVKNYLVASITASISLILLIISVSILIDNQIKP